MKHVLKTLIAASTLAAISTSAFAQERITYKSAKTTSSYYQMGVQISEAMRAGTDGGVVVTVEES
ncbi:MAG: hypothetical protein ABJP79_03115 [Tateyamaria sp.]|uniref:hypothetical protein n=1 Tax=Tateyamaria sp. TaxID=1929288 RepID=UPI00329FFB14